MKARLIHVFVVSTGPIRVANTSDETKTQRKPFETLLAYLETFGRWVPLEIGHGYTLG